MQWGAMSFEEAFYESFVKEEKSKDTRLEVLEEMLSSWDGELTGDLIVGMQIVCRKQKNVLEMQAITQQIEECMLGVEGLEQAVNDARPGGDLAFLSKDTAADQE